jgi:hypothetical protein
VFVDELNRLLSVPACDCVLVSRALDGLRTMDDRHIVLLDWSAISWMTETSQITVTQIVTEDYYKVRFLRCLDYPTGNNGHRNEKQSNRYGPAHFHRSPLHLREANDRSQRSPSVA